MRKNKKFNPEIFFASHWQSENNFQIILGDLSPQAHISGSGSVFCSCAARRATNQEALIGHSEASDRYNSVYAARGRRIRK